MNNVTYALALALGCAGMPAFAANAAEENAVAYVQVKLEILANESLIWGALALSNHLNMNLKESEILAKDEVWRSEIGTKDPSLINAIANSAASDYLRMMVDESGGRITEIIVMDATGLNAAVSNITSDYWQGDEEKFSETFPKWPGAVHEGEIEFDESANIYQQQISLTLVDPAIRFPVGAVTFGVDAAAFN